MLAGQPGGNSESVWIRHPFSCRTEIARGPSTASDVLCKRCGNGVEGCRATAEEAVERLGVCRCIRASNWFPSGVVGLPLLSASEALALQSSATEPDHLFRESSAPKITYVF